MIIVSTSDISNDAGRQSIISQTLESSTDDPTDFALTELGMKLRDEGHIRWAESAFALASTIPHQRPIAQFQLAILLSLTGRLAQAIAIFQESKANITHSPAQDLYVARQLARAGQFSEAEDLLSSIFGREAEIYYDIIAETQFIAFIRQFPLDSAKALQQRIETSYHVLSLEQVFANIEEAVKRKIPYSLIRVGDGEGINIRLSPADEGKFSSLYDRGRSEYHQMWYSGTELLHNATFIAELFRVQLAYARSDCVSIIEHVGLDNEYQLGSPRGIPAIVNMYRYFAELDEEADRPLAVCDCNINRSLLLSGKLSNLLQDSEFVGLVSCYEQLPQLLQFSFNIRRIEFIQTCGEFASRAQVTMSEPDSSSMHYFLNSHFQVCERLRDIEKGGLYVVAAGIFGKIYCDIIKTGGGVAIDIGSVADIWMNVSTRKFTEDEMVFCLNK